MIWLSRFYLEASSGHTVRVKTGGFLARRTVLLCTMAVDTGRSDCVLHTAPQRAGLKIGEPLPACPHVDARDVPAPSGGAASRGMASL